VTVYAARLFDIGQWTGGGGSLLRGREHLIGVRCLKR
jgi:hypothetical protein